MKWIIFMFLNIYLLFKKKKHFNTTFLSKKYSVIRCFNSKIFFKYIFLINNYLKNVEI